MSGSFQSFLQLSGGRRLRTTEDVWRLEARPAAAAVELLRVPRGLKEDTATTTRTVLAVLQRPRFGKESQAYYYHYSGYPTTTFFPSDPYQLLLHTRGCAKSFLVLLFGMKEAAKAPHKNVTPFLHCRMRSIVMGDI